MRPGDLVAVRTDHIEGTPWIGKVIKVDGDKVKLVWMEGGYDKPWKVTKIQTRGRKVEWKDSVPLCSIILFGFELTKGGKLKHCTVKELKSSYAEYCK